MTGYNHGDSCPICGTGRLERKVVDETFEYKGEGVTVSGYVIFECDVCKEAIVDHASSRKADRVLKDFYRSVDGLLPSSDIKRIRKNLGLTQEEMAAICGGGKKSFARYESGQVMQSKGMDNLLRIIDRFPFVITALMPKESSSTNVVSMVDFKTKVRYRQIASPIEYNESTTDANDYAEQLT